MIAPENLIEDGVAERLQPLKAAGQVRAIAPYNGELGADPESAKTLLQGRVPAILISISGSPPPREVSTKRRRAHVDVNVELYVVTNTPSTREARNRSPGTGAYAILYAVLRQLLGHKLDDADGIHFGVLVPGQRLKEHHSPDMQIWRQSYTVVVDVAAAEPMSPDITAIDSSFNAQEGEDAAGDPLLQAENTP